MNDAFGALSGDESPSYRPRIAQESAEKRLLKAGYCPGALLRVSGAVDPD